MSSDGDTQSSNASRDSVGLHAKVILLALARGAHFPIARLVSVLGGTWRADDIGVQDGAADNSEAPFLQVFADRLKQLNAQLMLLQQMPEVEDRHDAQHRLKTHRWTAVARLGIKWLDLSALLVPRNYITHLQEGLFSARWPAETLKTPGGKGVLFHRDPSVVNTARILAESET